MKWFYRPKMVLYGRKLFYKPVNGSIRQKMILDAIKWSDIPENAVIGQKMFYMLENNFISQEMSVYARK